MRLVSNCCDSRSRQAARFASNCAACLPDVTEQFHQVPNPDVFHRTHGILDLVGQTVIDATGHERVELLYRVFPCEWMGSEAWVVLDLVLDHSPVLQMDDDLSRHFPWI